MDPPSSSLIVFSGKIMKRLVQIYKHGMGGGKPPQIVWTHPLLPFPNSVQRLLLLLIPPNRTNHIEVIPCVVQVHRPLLEVITQLSVDIMRGVPLPKAKRLAV